MPNLWRLYAQQTLKLEEKFSPYIVGVIKNFREQFINDYQHNGKDHALSQLSLRTAHNELIPIITTIYRTAGLMGARMTATEIRKMVTQKDFGRIMTAKSASFGRNEQWVKDVMSYLEQHMLGFVQNITDTMRSDIIKILQKGVDNGWGIAETVQQLQNEGLIKARAKVIARTEINRAANVGHSTAAKTLPYEVDKSWVGAGDHRERHSHLMTNNHTVAELGTFEVPVFEGEVQIGTDHMQFPGDPNAHPSNTINCRCRIIFKPKRDANGRLIMRQPSQATIIPMARPTVYTPEQIAAQLKAHITICVK